MAARSTVSRRVAAGYVAMHTARARESCLFCGGRGALVVRIARGGGALVRVMAEWTEEKCEEWLLGEKKVDGRTIV